MPSPPPPPPPPPPPSASSSSSSIISHWIRGNEIGSGSFGRVSLAINRANGELFAVKSVARSGCASEEALKNEFRILSGLHSPHVVRCLGGDQTLEDGVPTLNLFMEYMGGGNLTDMMKKFGCCPLEEPLVRVYTRGILQGLQYLHSRGVVHCDIKGKNVLIGSSGGIKIADFGSAKCIVVEENEHLSEKKKTEFEESSLEMKELHPSSGYGVRGTPLWMAPEVIQGRDQGPESDIWSLGCTVIEMATGRPPWSFTARGLMAALMQKEERRGGDEEEEEEEGRGVEGEGETEGRSRRLRRRRNHPEEEQFLPLPDCLSEEGKDFLSRCLQRDPKQRWTSEELLKHPFVEMKEEKVGMAIDHCAEKKISEEEGGHSNGVMKGAKVPLSPTSVLDLSCSAEIGQSLSSEWNRSIPELLHFDKKKKKKKRKGGGGGGGGAATDGGGWITVRSWRGSSDGDGHGGRAAVGCGRSDGGWEGGGSSQRPLSSFMRGGGDVAGVVRRSAGDVDFECCSFLRRRSGPPPPVITAEKATAAPRQQPPPAQLAELDAT